MLPSIRSTSQRGGAITIEPLDPASPAAQALIAGFDEYMSAVYGTERASGESMRRLALPDVHLLGAFIETSLIGCGAVKTVADEGYAEIKSVYVALEHRGRGVSKQLMHALERYLVETGVRVARLATGIRQPTAIALYESIGYVHRAPFGNYIADPQTVYMEKSLGS